MITKRVGVFPILAMVAIGCTGGRVVRDSDGNAYVAKVMSDGRTWTTENLRLALPSSYCHSDAASECLRFGRLYTWASAAEACGRLGTGWRLPTDNEWRQLAKASAAHWAIPMAGPRSRACSQEDLQDSTPFWEVAEKRAAATRASKNTASIGPPPNPTRNMRGSTISASEADC